MKNTHLVLKQCVRIIALILFCPVFHVSGQEVISLESGSSLKEDTLRINEYIAKARRQESVPPDTTLKLLFIANRLAQKRRLRDKTATIWTLTASTYASQGNFKQCRVYLDSAFRLAEQMKDGKMICFLHTIAAYVDQYSSNYAQAAKHYFQAIETVRQYKISNSTMLPSIYNNMGALMTLLDEDSLALQYKLLAKRYVLELKPVDSIYLSYILVNIGQTYLQDSSVAAINYFRDAYQLARDGKDILFSFRVLINLTRAYIGQKQYDSAGYYLHLAENYAVTNPTRAEKETVAGLLNLRKRDYSMAGSHLLAALQLAQDDAYESLGEIYQGLSEVYDSTGQYKKALGFLQKYLVLHEKKMDDHKKVVVDFMLNLQAMEHEKSIMQKQAEIAKKETAVKRRNQWIVVMCVVSFLLCVILILGYRNYSNRKKILSGRMKAIVQNQEIERLKAEAEGADKERTRIAYDLHDGVMVSLSNVKMTLNTLPASYDGLSENNQYHNIVGQLEAACRELRSTAHNLMPEILLEDGAAQAIFYFCKATEQSGGIVIRFQQVGDALPRLQTHVETALYRIVQGLVQNILRHAQATTALVQLQYRDNVCAITVEDNGHGMDEKSREGYGLKSIRNRVKLLNGIFDIESEAGHGTTAYLEFDITPFLNEVSG